MSRWGHTGEDRVGQNTTAQKDQRLRLCSGGIFGYGPGYDVEHERIVWAKPKFPGDYAQGGICAATGYWAPGSAMVIVDGMRFIREFAPERVNKDG
jgi:hypothetical protein